MWGVDGVFAVTFKGLPTPIIKYDVSKFDLLLSVLRMRKLYFQWKTKCPIVIATVRTAMHKLARAIDQPDTTKRLDAVYGMSTVIDAFGEDII